MFETVKNIIGYTGTFEPGSLDELLIYICAALIIVSFCILTDLLYRVLRSLWR